MKKTILFVLLVILIAGCAQVDEVSNKTKETISKEPAQPKEKTQIKEKTVQIKEPETQEAPPQATEVKAILNVGETKTLTLGGKQYKIRLLSVSNRARFVVNGEFTKELLVTATEVLNDQSELRLVRLLYNAAEIALKLPPEKEIVISDAGLKGSGPETLATGIFEKVEKTTAGRAEIIRTAEGSIVLQLHSFLTEPGSRLYIYLVDQNIGDGLEIAKLTSITGGQTYELPEDIDLTKYKKIAIYSQSEEKTYGEAKLS
ncbi:DM13 domain-containing protein [Candidatus Woesearchaeota archaeon]|nr:DM13 domain-containing protein [Candidatus Woesearchaeota archaeon]